MKDWDKMTLKEHFKHLETKFLFDSSGTAKSVHELLKGYAKLEQENAKYKEALMDIEMACAYNNPHVKILKIATKALEK